MTAYVSDEKEKKIRGTVVHNLTADGKTIKTKITVLQVSKLMREIMKPGDTYQETYANGSKTRAIPYEDMLKSWEKDDAFERGEY